MIQTFPSRLAVKATRGFGESPSVTERGVALFSRKRSKPLFVPNQRLSSRSLKATRIPSLESPCLLSKRPKLVCSRRVKSAERLIPPRNVPIHNPVGPSKRMDNGAVGTARSMLGPERPCTALTVGPGSLASAIHISLSGASANCATYPTGWPVASNCFPLRGSLSMVLIRTLSLFNPKLNPSVATQRVPR